MQPLERTCIPGLIYGNANDAALTIDLYLPEFPNGAPGPIPVVVYFHGGGWVRGSNASPSAVWFGLELSAMGVAVACPTYRFAPKHPAPAAIEDAKLAVRWVKSQALKYGLDAGRVIAMGNSAGGHLAAMLALTREADGFEGEGLRGHSSEVAACIDVCGIADIASFYEEGNAPLWVQAWVPPTRPDHMELARRCSPIQYVRREAPPTLILHGDADESVPYEQSRRLFESLRDAGADVELVKIRGAGHMLGITGPAAVQQVVIASIRQFLAKQSLIGEAPLAEAASARPVARPV